MLFSASSPRRIASSLSNSVMPRPLPLDRSMSIIMPLASSSPGGGVSYGWLRTNSIASSTWSGSPSNVATRAYIALPSCWGRERPYSVESSLAQRDVVEQEVRWIGRVAVVVVVEPEHDGLSAVRRHVEARLGPSSRVRADVEHGGQRRTGGVADLHLDLVVGERVRAVRLVPERQRRLAGRDGHGLRQGAVAVDGARGSHPR